MSDKASPASSELLLRFACEHCANLRTVPVRKLKAVAASPCPHCQQTAGAPQLDRHSRGVSELMASSAAVVETACPDCGSGLAVPAGRLKATRRCPACGSSLRFEMVAVEPVPANGNGVPSPTALGVTTTLTITNPTCTLSTELSPVQPEDVIILPGTTPSEVPEIQIYRESRAPLTAPRSRRPPLQPREMRWVVWFCLQFIMPAVCLVLMIVGNVTEDWKLILFPFLLAAFWVFPLGFVFWFVSPWLARLLIRKLHCPGCHEEFDVFGVWNCGCGYNDHKSTNIMLRRCPKCGGFAGHTDCPRCDCTILL